MKFFLIFALCLPASAQLWNGVVAPARAVDWSATHPGVTGVAIGALPDAAWANCVTSACNTVFAGTVTKASIEAALSSCTSNQVVRVPVGSFTLGGWKNTTSNCVLRGQGAAQTLLTINNSVSCPSGITGFVGICNGSSSQNWKGGIANGPTNLSGTFTKGQTSLTFASVTNLAVNGIVILDQLDDSTDTGAVLYSETNDANVTAGPPTCVSTGQVAPCGTVGPISLEGNGGGAQRTSPSRQLSQIVTVTDIVGNVVTFIPGLASDHWNSGNTPQAWWATSSSLLHNAGIEDMSIDIGGAGSVPGIAISNAYNFWVKGVRMINSNRSHVQLDYVEHVTVRDSYFFLTQNSASQSYGIECDDASDVLIENNILQAIVSPLMVNGACTGGVYAYNFQINNYYSVSSGYNIPGTDLHTAGIDNMLFEGNYGNVFTGDVFHGSQNFVTLFRNRFTGPQPKCYISGSNYANSVFGTCNNSLNVIQNLSYSRFHNYIGNVLGTTGTNTNYESGANNTKVWDVGSGNSEAPHTPVPNDPNVLPSLMRWGNCDSATGFNACRFVAGEVPSGLTGSQAPYANSVPGNNNLPSSFYYSSTPAWWPAAKAWPPIGPDVTGGNVPGVNGHAYTLPAQDCFLNTMGGPSDGTGPVLTFNASTCYSVSATPTATFTPSSLSFSSQGVGTTSASQGISLSNTGTATMNISSIVVAGTNPGDFSQTNTCSSTLAVSSSCTINVTFTPPIVGARSANITVTSDASNSPTVAGLSGTGIIGFSLINGVSLHPGVTIH